MRRRSATMPQRVLRVYRWRRCSPLRPSARRPPSCRRATSRRRRHSQRPESANRLCGALPTAFPLGPSAPAAPAPLKPSNACCPSLPHCHTYLPLSPAVNKPPACSRALRPLESGVYACLAALAPQIVERRHHHPILRVEGLDIHLLLTLVQPDSCAPIVTAAAAAPTNGVGEELSVISTS